MNEAHQMLLNNMFDSAAMDLVKDRTNKMLKLNQMEENILKQKIKIDWLKLGDGNNAFFITLLERRIRITI